MGSKSVPCLLLVSKAVGGERDAWDCDAQLASTCKWA